MLGGCAAAAEKAVEQTTGVSVSEKDDTVTIKGKDGESVTINSSMPDELKAFPLPSGFKYESGGSSTSAQGQMSIATWKGKGNIAAIGEFYKKTAADQGWTVGLTMGDGEGGQLQANAKDGKNYMISFSSQEDGEIEISVMVSKSKS